MSAEMAWFVCEAKLVREAAATNTAKLGKDAPANHVNATAIQAALLQQIKDKDNIATLPPLPKLGKQSEWPKFHDIVKSYLRKDRYSLGLSNNINHIALGGPYNNGIVPAAFDHLLINKLYGDALAIFQHTGNKYTGKGFAKLKCLQKLFADKSQSTNARKLFTFFMGHDQGSLTPLQYECSLLQHFETFASSGNPLTTPLQVMFMIRGLAP